MEQSSAPGPAPRMSRRPRRVSSPRAPAEPARRPTLRDLGHSLVEGRWSVLGALFLSSAIGAIYLGVASPVYHSSALLQVDDRAAGEASRLEDLSALFAPRANVDGEIQILRSRAVVGGAVDRLRLDVEASPRRFPLIGRAMARRYVGREPAAPPLSLPFLARFAWGGERIAVEQLEVPDALLGQPLTLTVLPERRFRVADEDGHTIAEGRVGSRATPGPAAGGLVLLLSQLEARPGSEFKLTKQRREGVVTALHDALSVQEQGGTGRKGGASTGIISVALEGDDPLQVARVLSVLCDLYLRDNVERSTSEAARTLEILEAQLPQLKAGLEQAETALAAFRRRTRTVDLSLEAKATVERSAEIDKRIAEMASTLEQLRQRYSEGHPDLIAASRALDAARAEQTSITPWVSRFPDAQLASTALRRDVAVATDLYLMLLHRAQELRVMKVRGGTARLVDRPFPADLPVRPRPGLVAALALLLGLAGGVAVALARRALDEGTEDPQDIEGGTGLPVFLTVPHSRRELKLHRAAGKKERVPLAQDAPGDVAVETLRALRSVLGFLLKARPRVVAISSPSPGVGKTFVCTNLAHLLAAAGQRVLLVDADLRRGELHRHFSAPREPGLSNVLQGGAALADAIRASGVPGLDLLTSGTIPLHPAELVGGTRLHDAFAAAAARYDVVVVDTPPVLAVADAIPVARVATVTLLVLGARRHSISEIALALDRLARSGVQVQGGILNDASPASGTYGRVYQHRSAAEAGDVAGTR